MSLEPATSRNPSRSLQLEQRISHIHRLAGLDVDLRHRAVVLGPDLVLHLHGFEDEDALAGGDFLAFLDEEGDDATGHVGLHGLAAAAALATAGLGGQVRERVRHFDGTGAVDGAHPPGVLAVPADGHLVLGAVETQAVQAGAGGLGVDLVDAVADDDLVPGVVAADFDRLFAVAVADD